MERLTQLEAANAVINTHNEEPTTEAEQPGFLTQHLELGSLLPTPPNIVDLANATPRFNSAKKSTINRLYSRKLTPAKILSLQRTIGNQAVNRVLANTIAQREQAATNPSLRTAVQRVAGASSQKAYPTVHKNVEASAKYSNGKLTTSPNPSAGVARTISPNIIQRSNHLAVGAMLHHAPDESIGNTNIDPTNNAFYRENEVIASHRGELLDDQISGGEFEWKFSNLATKIASMRATTGLTPGQFPVIVNANWMISPGYQKKPKEYIDQEKAVMAVSSVWGFQYQNPPIAVKSKAESEKEKEKEKESTENPSYTDLLKAWEDAPDNELSTRKLVVNLGNNAKKLLRSKAKARVTAETRNEVIPHRGLRNYLFTPQGYALDFIAQFQNEADFVHIITLDSDTQFEDGEVLKEIGVAAETKMKSGIMVTATDYIYDRSNLFAWFAGALDKVARYKLEKGEETFDAYPAEPGLTISFDMKNFKHAAEFLSDNPFGQEDSVNPRDSMVFKELVESRQSVEGKNLRAKWRKLIKDPKAHINRTVGNLSVTESDEQATLQVRTLKAIAESAIKSGQVEPALIGKLISGDNYHSLTKDRNKSDNAEAKLKAQHRILEDSTVILNKVLKQTEQTAITKAVTEPNSEECKTIKAMVKAELQKYLKDS